MSEMIIADGILYERVFPRYEGDYEPAPRPSVNSVQQTRGDRWKATRAKGKSPDSVVGLTRAERVLRALLDGSRTRGQLSRNLHMSNGDLKTAIDTLVDEGRVKHEVIPPSHGSHGQIMSSYSLMRDTRV